MTKRKHVILLSLIDIAILYFTYAAVAAMMFLFESFRIKNTIIGASVVALPVAYLAICGICKINETIWRYSSEKDYLKLFFSVLGAEVAFSVLFVVRDFSLRHTMYYIISAAIGASAVVMSRILYRIIVSGNTVKNEEKLTRRLLIVGAGHSGSMMLSEILNNPHTGFNPIGFVDDDMMKYRRVIKGVKVLGTVEEIENVCRENNVDDIYIAIPSASIAQRERILNECAKTNCSVKILPYYSEFSSGDKDFLSKIRDITPEELLGREPVAVASDETYEFVGGKTALITGGGGSIGSELCRQVAAHSPGRLVIVDIYENNAYSIQQELLNKYGDKLNLEVYIASVRDKVRLEKIFEKEKPDIVFHAAAHKHVPLMEVSPMEAVKNNVFGTFNTAMAAMKSGVDRFILISTDKAVNPTNIMGATKRACEMVICYFASLNSNTTYAAVRFGNVLGSNGSVIPLFKKQIENKQDVTVTDPNIIRYFMTIPEAAQLVLTAGAMAKGGEIFVLDMGKPVKIYDLACKMISLAGLTLGKDIDIKIVGLRPGEKLYEELLMSEEGLKTTTNRKIFIGNSVSIDFELFLTRLKELREYAYSADVTNAGIEERLMCIVPTFKRAEIDNNKGGGEVSTSSEEPRIVHKSEPQMA